MRIIDLLNKIASGEEVPEKIKVNNIIYEYRSFMYCTEKANYQDIEDYLFGKWNFNILNEEIEIIEEDKKIEKLNIELNSFDDNKVNCYRANNLECDLAFKINEVIDEVNKLKDDNK